MFANTGRMGEAEQVFGQILREWLTPSTITMNVLLKAYVRSGNVDKAVGVLEAMERQAPEAYGAQVDEGTYNIVISGLVEQRRVGQAWTLVDRQRGAGYETNKSGMYGGGCVSLVEMC